MPEKILPKILYIADVPVELSYAGATLIYRLLEFYPKDKLLILQGMNINQNQRIEGVYYINTEIKWLDRLSRTRVKKLITPVKLLLQFFLLRQEKKIIEDFKPDVILTVSFRLMWLKAFRLAIKKKLPIHLILHDDWLTTENYGLFNKYLKQQFEDMYKYASANYCISPQMEDYYYKKYNKHGTIIYPHRGKNDITYCPKSKSKKATSIKYCYAGSLFTGDFVLLLNNLSEMIFKSGGELHIFSFKNEESISDFPFLQIPYAFFNDMIHPHELKEKMNQEMDVGILINSFQYPEPFKYNFSSKLVDYTTAALPVLFFGPYSSGAIQWALKNNYSAIVAENSSSEIEKKISDLGNSIQREIWAKQLTVIGQQEFNYENNYSKFEQGLLNTNV